MPKEMDDFNENLNSEFSQEEVDILLKADAKRKKKILLIGISTGMLGVLGALVFLFNIWDKVSPDPTASDSLLFTSDSVLLQDRSQMMANDTKVEVKPEVEVPTVSGEPYDEAYDAIDIKTDPDVLAMLEDELFQLLNAEVTIHDTRGLTDEEFYMMLFEPLTPVPALPSASRLGMPTQFSFKQPEKKVDVDETAKLSLEVETHYKAQIDSLQRVIKSINDNLQMAENSNAGLRRTVSRLSVSSDSLKDVELRRLTKIIEEMSPLQAAMLIADLPEDDMKDLMFRVKPKTAARIIQELPPAIGQMIADLVMRR